ncbi:MAG: hypothetical protein AAGN64_12035, partial [Bacteroidota bacterium]
RLEWRRTDVGDPVALATLVETLLARLWDTDLTTVPGFASAIVQHLSRALAQGIPAAVDALLAEVAGRKPQALDCGS